MKATLRATYTVKNLNFGPVILSYRMPLVGWVDFVAEQHVGGTRVGQELSPSFVVVAETGIWCSHSRE